MKVRIMQRSVYHKYAEVEIEIPDNVKDIQEWIIENEQTYIYEMDQSINESKYEFAESSSEWRYECEELKEGGHL
jgi:hypothetical protein